MTSWSARYRAGECFAVWDELRAYGSTGVPEALYGDAEEVARETMSRVAANIDLVVERLADAGYAFAFPEYVCQPPTADDRRAITQAEQSIGPLPLALRACMEIVGGVDLCGDGGAVLPHVSYHFDPGEDADLYPDPLVLMPGRHLWSVWRSRLEGLVDEGACPDPAQEAGSGSRSAVIDFVLAPDEIHKANVSGGEQRIRLPDRSADPELWSVPRRKGVTLVEYLRTSLSWGGFPGYDDLPAGVPWPEILEELRRDLVMF
ncbi:hypothetical protein [Streptosporangium fragile]